MAARSELADLFTLHTLEEVSDLFPISKAKKSKMELVETYARRFGTYREFDGTMLFTTEDIEALYTCLRAAGPTKGRPSSDTDGFLVIMGNRIDTNSNVGLFFAPMGKVQNVVDQVESQAMLPVQLLDYAPMTYGQYEDLLEKLKSHKDHGYWFYRERQVNDTLLSAIPTDAHENEEAAE